MRHPGQCTTPSSFFNLCFISRNISTCFGCSKKAKYITTRLSMPIEPIESSSSQAPRTSFLEYQSPASASLSLSVYPPMYPAYLSHTQTGAGMRYPDQCTTPSSFFTLCFISRNISTCFGCKNWFAKKLQPPNDLLIRSQDWREFLSPVTDTPQERFGNVYYHCRTECVWIRWPAFLPQQITVLPDVLQEMTETHKEYVSPMLGLDL